MVMRVDNIEVLVGKTFFDDRLGAGIVDKINFDSFELLFGRKRVTYYNDGYIAGIKRLRADRPIMIYPTDAQMTIVMGMLELLNVKVTR